MIKLIFLTLFSWSSPDMPDDSLRMETINGKQFIIHQVSEKETLYSISRRYGTPITTILEYNPKAATNLDVGQVLQVLYIAKVRTAVAGTTTHRVAAKETLFSISKLYDVSIDDLKTWNNLKDNGLSLGQELIVRKGGATKEFVPTVIAKQSPSAHIVEAKETLFSIARNYNITVQQLKDWNGIQGNEVKVGQVLMVTHAGTTTVVQTKENPIKEVKPPEETKIIPVVKEVEVKENPIRISENVQGTNEIKEGGLAEMIDGTEGNRKYLGLHRTIKTGSIIKVRNELNNREVFVRIVGPLPSTGVNDNIVIKVSKSAYDRLGAIDSKFRVEVTYYK